MKRFLFVFFLKIIPPVLILAVGIVSFQILSNRPPVVAQAAEKPTDPLVETVQVSAHNQGLDIETDGVVVPHREVYLSSEVEGRVTFKADVCKAGNYVEEGTLLFEIDPRDYELEVRRLQKELAQADANLQENEVETQNAESMVKLSEEDLGLQRKELQRVENLSQRGVITESEIDTARRNELAARNALQVQKNMLQLQKSRRVRLTSARELAATQLEKSGLALSRTKIKAPLSGLIIEDMVEQDTHVQSGTQLVRINDSSTAEVKCSLKMEELFWIWNQTPGIQSADTEKTDAMAFEIPETPVTVNYQLLGRNFHWQGKLSRYEGTGLDVQTRTVPCRVVVNKPARELRVTDDSGQSLEYHGPRAMVTGMYVTVQVHAHPAAQLLSVPEQAVRPGNQIWLVRDGKLQIEKIQPAETIDQTVIIPAESTQLKVGDHVIVSPLPVAESGMAVREQAASQP